MSPNTTHQEECESMFNTSNLAASVRDELYRMAHDLGHATGKSDTQAHYEDLASLVVLAVAASDRVNEAREEGIRYERARIAQAVHPFNPALSRTIRLGQL